ncbi:MAG: glycosyltransferase [Nitrospirae bacterium]|nr:glycosyltransferase [Nitrospirota bacterium]
MKPTSSEGKKDVGRFWWLAALLAFIIGVWYLYWRITATFNTEDNLARWISITVYSAEVYGFLAFIFFFLQVRKGPARIPPVIETYPAVDVFVTIYNESIEVLYRTIVCCQAMEYPEDKKKVYILDDGNRKEVKDLAEHLNCAYLSRPTHKFAKAGNINYGLAHSTGEIIAIFDCDHIPVRTFLTETAGYFKDPDVAIVQTPHYFYNPDSFQRNLRLEKELSNEQDLFFRVIEPGRDYYNSSFFAGSSGLFRKKALTEIGGIQTLTITEDLHTSMVLHARGYKSIYVPRILASGLAPESFEGYLKQRKRWTRGGLQVFLLDNPLIKRGLTLWQRIQYFAAVYYFLHGIPRLIYLSAPLTFLLFGYAPLRTSFGSLLTHFLPYYIASLIAFHMVSKRLRNPFWSDVYETATSFSITATAFATFLNPGNKKFHVTPKGLHKAVSKFNLHLVYPHIILSGLLLIGITTGFYNLFSDRQVYPDAFRISIFWGIYNIILLVAAISTASERREVRVSPRLKRMIPGDILFDNTKIPFITSDISDSGISIMLSGPQITIPLFAKIHLHGDNGERVSLTGMVMRNDILSQGEMVTVGIHFMKVSEENRQAIARMMFSSPHTWDSPPEASAGVYLSFLTIVISPLRLFLHEKVLHRFYPRIKKEIPCEIVRNGTVNKGVIKDISYTGVRAKIYGALSLENDIILKIYNSNNRPLSIEGRIAWIKKAKGDTLAGVHFMEHNSDLLELLKG